MSETMLSPLEKTIKIAYTLPKTQQDSLAVIVEQFCKSVTVDNKAKKKVVGIADGKYKVPDDLSVYDEEVAKLFGIS